VNARHAVPAELGGAASAPRTRRSLRRKRFGCLVVACLGALLVAGAVAMRVRQDDGRLQASGAHATATVDAVRLTRAGGAGGPSGFIDVHFVDGAGVTRQASINLGRVAPRYPVGQAVDVVYDAGNPAVVQVVGRPANAAAVPWPFLLGLGALALVVAAATARRVRWQTRVLRANPWVEVPAHLLEVPLAGGTRHAITLVELQGAPDEGAVLAAAAMWRARPMVDLIPRAWVAGSDRRFIVAAVGGAPIVRAKRVQLMDGDHDVVRPASTPPTSQLGPSN
jgi:hypothetical protein